MASSNVITHLKVTITFLICLSATTTSLSQNTGTPATIAQCGPRLLPLAPCGPFVQGTSPSPAQSCCDNLKQLYNQQPGCLCLLLNNTGLLSSFPINTTLALNLPLLCSLQVDMSTCSGIHLPSTSPAAQVSFGTKPNSTVAASPIVTGAPRSSGFVGFGSHYSGSQMLKKKVQMVALLVVAATASLWADVLR